VAVMGLTLIVVLSPVSTTATHTCNTYIHHHHNIIPTIKLCLAARLGRLIVVAAVVDVSVMERAVRRRSCCIALCHSTLDSTTTATTKASEP